MKKLMGLFAAVSIMAVIGCSDTGVSTVSNDVQGTHDATAWTTPANAPTYTGPLAVSKLNGMLMGKPLTTIVFTEVPFQVANGLHVNGVTFSYTVNGVASNDAYFNTGGPSPGPYVAPPVLEGGTGGVLKITFDEPTDVVEFGFAISRDDIVSDAITVNVIGPNNKSRGVFVVEGTPAPLFTGGMFTYTKNAVKALEITFSQSATRFAIDNLVFHQDI